MTHLRNRLAVTLLLSFFFYSSAQADDIDIFMNPGATSTDAPNVLIIVDNTANWSRNVTGNPIMVDEVKAIHDALKKLLEDGTSINVGLMMYTSIGGESNNTKGGYVHRAIAPIDQDFLDLLAGADGIVASSGRASDGDGGLDINDNKADSARWATTMHEAYLYFTGDNAYAGNKSVADVAAFDVPKTNYKDPGASSVCEKKYIIFVSNGGPDNGENTTAESLLSALGGKLGSDPIGLNPSGRQANWADEYSRFMYATQDIVTYTIDVHPVSTGQGDDNSALLASMANQADAECFAVGSDGCSEAYTGGSDADILTEIFENIFDKIQSVNSVFASSSLPVSLNVRGETENQVYIGVFRPDPNAYPRWDGNLKAFKLGKSDPSDPESATVLVDQNGAPIQDSATKFINDDTVSFWTKSGTTYWSYHPTYAASDSPDGPIVEKGGAAQQIRVIYDTSDTTNFGRTVYTCSTCANNSSLEAFNDPNTNITTAALGAADAAERTNLIEWVLGTDNVGTGERTLGEVRPSVHGDIIHSTPLVFNYSNASTDRYVVFYGGNDGALRAVEGGLGNVPPAGADPEGKELWSFVAPEFYSNLKRLRDNNTAINVPSIPGDSNNKPYFFDGGLSVYIEDGNGDGYYDDYGNGDKVHLFVSMRRGGRFIYAFDVSDPDNPSLLWKKGCFGSPATCDTGYGELGQTWSKPVPVRYNNGGTATIGLLFGGGYDPMTDDAWPPSTSTRTMGRGIFIVDPSNGAVVWQAGNSPSGGTTLTVSGMDYSIPGEIAVRDSNGDGYHDTGWVGDTGGNIWRINFSDPAPANWQVEKMASLGGTGVNARRFLHRVDVIKSESPSFVGILVGSGDREHPLDAVDIYDAIHVADPTSWVTGTLGGEIQDRFYMIKDVSGATYAESDLIDATSVGTTVNLSTSPGWYIQLGDGEKVVGRSRTQRGATSFSTSTPPTTTIDPNTCAGNLGIARQYLVNYLDGAPVVETDGIAGFSEADRVVDTGTGLNPESTPFNIADGSGSGLITGVGVTSTVSTGSPFRKRMFWYKEYTD